MASARPMIERIVDAILARFVTGKVPGWNARLGGAVTIVLAVIGILSVGVESLQMVQDGHAYAALRNLNSPEMWAALGGLGLTKQMLGNRIALGALAEGQAKAETQRIEIAEDAKVDRREIAEEVKAHG